jgi:3-hydroxyisobutyrate dehydrogenase-like beta-hydroxyacid dehydrogenase
VIVSTIARSTRIGFCGIGRMGEPMAHRLIAAGHVLRVWNRSRAKLDALIEKGAIACDTPAELANDVDIAILCLADGAAVDETVFGELGLARAAHTPVCVVDHSTLSPMQTRRLAQHWNAVNGGFWIDAPVSGGTAGAAAGTLAIMAGGEAAGVAAVEPVLAAYSSRVTRMGGIGAGQAAKLANQVIVATTIASIAEAATLAKASGIDAGLLPDALRGGWADSVLLQALLPRMLSAPATASGTIRIMLKDLDAIEALADQTGIRLTVLTQVRALMTRAVQAGLGDEDISQIVRVI